MNTCKSIGLALIAFAVLAHAGDKPPLSRSETLHLAAKVESIDKPSRTLTLKGDEGTEMVVAAGPEVRNFDRIKPGDRILLAYTIGVAAQVKPKGTPLSAPVEGSVEKRSRPDENPSYSTGHSIFTTVKIESVDTSFNTVTFKRSDGITRTVGVDSPDGQKFIRTLKPGDSVEISYTEAAALSLEPVAAR
jgi:hypothetical protein